jgi:ribosome biogenesis GTPase A
MHIQWFPGHMGLTMKQLQEQRHTVDVFLELLDARAPSACQNPLLEQLIGDKPRVIILTKNDIADPEATAHWKANFEKRPNTRVVTVSAKERQNLGAITQTALDLVRSLKGPVAGSVRGMIVGIPNVGKSSLINALTRANKAPVAAKPGHTKGLKKIRLSPQFELVDTPGMLWHKFEDQETGQRLAMLGAIKDDVYDFQAICQLTVDFLAAHYPQSLLDRYRLEALGADAPATLEAIARKRGYIVRGGGFDLERTCTNLMIDFRSGALGRISLERPGPGIP